MNKVYLILLMILSLRLLAQDKLPPQDESFDPALLKEPTLPILDKTAIYEIVTDIVPSAPVNLPVDTVQFVEKMGWKVQIFSTNDFFLADSIYREAVIKFGDQSVEKVFDLPYYKIRVGNCETREQAERLLSRAQELSYFNAWVIRTRIKVKEKWNLYKSFN